MYVSRNWGFTPFPKEVFQEGRTGKIEWRGEAPTTTTTTTTTPGTHTRRRIHRQAPGRFGPAGAGILRAR